MPSEDFAQEPGVGPRTGAGYALIRSAVDILFKACSISTDVFEPNPGTPPSHVDLNSKPENLCF